MKRNDQDYAYLLSKIPFGQNNAVHMRELMVQLNVDDRTVRRWVNSARNAGHIILSGNFGYCRSNDLSEIKQSHTRRRRMAASIYRSEKSAGEALNETEGQMSLFDEDPGTRTEKNDGTETTAEA